MNWKRATIGQRIGIGFGLVLILLAVTGLLSLLGVGFIVDNASQVIDGNELDGTLAQMEVDHLNWANQVNALLTDESVIELKVQTDPTKCRLGRWLGEGGADRAIGLIPELKPVIDRIREPHKHLHESAIELRDKFAQPHYGLALELARVQEKHSAWVARVAEAMALESSGLMAIQQQLISSAQIGLNTIERFAQDEELMMDEIRQAKAKAFVKTLRYGEEATDYFWINDMTPKMVMHPFKPALEGKDLSGFKDPNGKKLFMEMVKVCKEQGEGFVTYEWPKPGHEKPVPKLSFVTLYKPWNWIIGTGFYLDEAGGAVLQRIKDLNAGKKFSLGVKTDSTKCALGKWLALDRTKAILKADPELKKRLDAIIKTHRDFHISGLQIEQMINALEMTAAATIFKNKTLKTSDRLQDFFKWAIARENKRIDQLREANAVFAEKTRPSLIATQAGLNRMRTVAKDHVMTDEVMLTEAKTTRLWVVYVGSGAILIGIFLAVFISLGIVRPMKRVSGAMNEAADQVSEAASQVASSSQQMADGAAHQAASLEETTATLSQMGATCHETTDISQTAEEMMQSNIDQSDQALRTLASLSDNMTEIENESKQIGSIIKTIDEIAFQTNLLALNAAVEAARAGEAGAGFAVVADEVRSLAIRAAEAADNTQSLLEGMAARITTGAESLRSVNSDFGRIVDGSKEMGARSVTLTKCSLDQSTGIDQITQVADQLEQVTQQNAASAEESASAAGQMSAQAQSLREMVAELNRMLGRTAGGDAPGAAEPVEKKAAEVGPAALLTADEDDDLSEF